MVFIFKVSYQFLCQFPGTLQKGKSSLIFYSGK
jgi:hypothetical protein